jgi:deoxyribonuclease-4
MKASSDLCAGLRRLKPCDYHVRMPRPVSSQRFGAHMSVAGGLENAISAALATGCDCLQIFVKNQKQWRAPPLTEDAAARFRSALGGSGLCPVVAHASYLINLASPDDALLARSIAAIIDEMHRCEAIGVETLVVHPGAHMGEGIEAGLRRVAESLDEIHTATHGFQTKLALETTAGQGSSLGHELAQLGRIIDQTREPECVAVCLDTCHLFAAGYDLRKPAEYERMVDEAAAQFGLGRIRCIHANDSKAALGSRLDRHEHIGKGQIGRPGFVNLLGDARLAHVPRILETPKGQTKAGTDFDRLNLRRMRSWAGLGPTVRRTRKGPQPTIE